MVYHYQDHTLGRKMAPRLVTLRYIALCLFVGFIVHFGYGFTYLVFSNWSALALHYGFAFSDGLASYGLFVIRRELISIRNTTSYAGSANTEIIPVGAIKSRHHA